MLIGWLNVQSLTNKTFIVNDLITERSLDVLALTETWHTDSNDVRLRLATPDGYAMVDAARQDGRGGGGVAVIYRKHLRCSGVSLPPLTTFEAVCVRLTTSSGWSHCVTECLSARFYTSVDIVLRRTGFCFGAAGRSLMPGDYRRRH